MQDEEVTKLRMPSIQWEDLLQQKELLKLEGVESPSLRIIKKSAITGREATFSNWLPSSAQVAFPPSPVPDVDVLERIVEWAMSQSDIVQGQVFQFLEDPTDEQLHHLLGELQLKEPEGNKEKPLSQMILALLSTRSHTLRELYDFARFNTNSRRPEASVRQLIRRFLSEGQIIEVSDGVYSLS